ncbi:hypothetical protein [Methanolinea mesophila]|uniref:hypothetical protein n=1 Tax=Methanolinea mesophila TaxID=547055 RepID=UPI001AE3BFFF|nr:hypothetical protein [Methanolinea mesophila]
MAFLFLFGLYLILIPTFFGFEDILSSLLFLLGSGIIFLALFVLIFDFYIKSFLIEEFRNTFEEIAWKEKKQYDIQNEEFKSRYPLKRVNDDFLFDIFNSSFSKPRHIKFVGKKFIQNFKRMHHLKGPSLPSLLIPALKEGSMVEIIFQDPRILSNTSISERDLIDLNENVKFCISLLKHLKDTSYETKKFSGSLKVKISPKIPFYFLIDCVDFFKKEEHVFISLSDFDFQLHQKDIHFYEILDPDIQQNFSLCINKINEKSEYLLEFSEIDQNPMFNIELYRELYNYYNSFKNDLKLPHLESPEHISMREK